MSDAIISVAARTPIGRSYRGALRETPARDLAYTVVEAVLQRSHLDPQLIDEVILAESLQGGGNIARFVAVALGMGSTPGLAVNRHCAGGMTAIQLAVSAVQSGMADAIIAGGSESLSMMPAMQPSARAQSTPQGTWYPPAYPYRRDAPPDDPTVTVGENTARLADLTRADQDSWALRSHAVAIAAAEAGHFDREIVPMQLADASTGQAINLIRDEGPRRGLSASVLAGMPVLHPELTGATITASNSAGVNDGAAAVLVTSPAFADSHDLFPLGRVRSWSTVAGDPAETGLMPIAAIAQALARGGLSKDDIGLFEINEAFCCVPLAAVRALNLATPRVNSYGSGCSLGHPIAATGTRMVVSMLHALGRTSEPYGVVAMCAGGGMGMAMVLETANTPSFPQ